MRRWSKMGAAAAVVAVVGLVGSAGADEASDRKKYLEEIERELDDAARYLDDLHRDSSSSDVDSALREIDSVERLLAQLERVQGSDAKAREVVSRYPGYARALREVAPYLKRLKDKQTSLRELPKKCQALDRRLTESLQRYVRNKDPDGLDKLPREAEQAGRDAESWWRDAESVKREMEDWRSRALRFSSARSRSCSRWETILRESRLPRGRPGRCWPG